MRNYESCPTFSQRLKSILDHRFTLAIKTRCCLIKDQYPWLRQNGSGDCDTLTLTTRKFHTAFANDSVIAFSETIDELFTVRDSAGHDDFIASRVWVRKANVRCDGSVKKEIVL